MAAPHRQRQPTPAARLGASEPRRESIPRKRLLLELQTAARRPLTVVVAPAGYGKTTAIVQWLERSEVDHAWLSVDGHDNDPRRFAAQLIAALDRVMPGELEAAQRTLHGGSDLNDTVVPLIVDALGHRSGGSLAIVLDDYQAISDARCHEVTRELVDALPAGVAVVIATRTEPPLRLARRRAAGTLAEIGPEQLRFEHAEVNRLLNGSLRLALDPAQIGQIEARVHGWAAGLTLIATALQGRDDRPGFLDAVATSSASLGAYLVEEVLETARPELRTFLCRTSIVTHLSAPLCQALLLDPSARALFDEVRRENLFVTALDSDGTWIRYHDVFAETLRRELERREPARVGELHRRASAWFEHAGMPEKAIEHALTAGDGPRAASLLAGSWLKLISDRRYATVRRLLDRFPAERGELGPLCEALDLLCMAYEGVDQRLTRERAQALVARHGDDTRVLQAVDGLLMSPFYGDIGRALQVGREARERYADDPGAWERILILYAFALWFAGRHDEVRALLEPRVHLQEPALSKIWTLAILALVAADEGDGELAERFAREATAEVEAIGGQTAAEFNGIPWVLAEALRVRGKLDEARRHLDRGLAVEARRPGSVGDAVALILDAQLALSEGDLRRAGASASRAREGVDHYPDLGALETRLAGIEAALSGELAAPADNPLLGTAPTPSELRILPLLDSELTLGEIAAELYVSLHTVKSHVRRLYRRLGAGTREAAVSAARERGLLDGGS
jgi:ATP/maltotriose-dependent transcriptional regulator MalT